MRACCCRLRRQASKPCAADPGGDARQADTNLRIEAGCGGRPAVAFAPDRRCRSGNSAHAQVKAEGACCAPKTLDLGQDRPGAPARWMHIVTYALPAWIFLATAFSFPFFVLYRIGSGVRRIGVLATVLHPQSAGRRTVSKPIGTIIDAPFSAILFHPGFALNGIMFEKRSDLVRFLAVVEAGRIATAADRLALTPAGAHPCHCAARRPVRGQIVRTPAPWCAPDRARLHRQRPRAAHSARDRGCGRGPGRSPVGADRQLPHHRQPDMGRNRRACSPCPLPRGLSGDRYQGRHGRSRRGAPAARRWRKRPALRRHRRRRASARIAPARTFSRRDRRNRRLARPSALLPGYRQ